MKKNGISRDMTFGELIRKHPESAAVFMKHGLHCIGCHMAAQETIEQGCRMHGMSEKEIDALIDELKQVTQKQQK